MSTLERTQDEIAADELIAATKLSKDKASGHYKGIDPYGNIWTVYSYENEKAAGWCGMLEMQEMNEAIDSTLYTGERKRDVVADIADAVIAWLQAKADFESEQAISEVAEPMVLITPELQEAVVTKLVEESVQRKAISVKVKDDDFIEEDVLPELKVRENRRYNAEQIQDMRARADRGEHFAAIGRMYGCSTQFVRNVCKRRVYKDVE